MGFSGLEGDCKHNTETLPRYCRNSHPRAENFNPYWLIVIVSFSCISFLEIKTEQMGLMFALIIALYFYSSIWMYAFIHKFSNDVIWLQHSYINFPWCHLIRRHQSTRVILHQRGVRWHFLTLVKTAENLVWYARIYTDLQKLIPRYI